MLFVDRLIRPVVYCKNILGRERMTDYNTLILERLGTDNRLARITRANSLPNSTTAYTTWKPTRAAGSS